MLLVGLGVCVSKWCEGKQSGQLSCVHVCVPLQVEEAVRARLTIEKEALLLRAANENYSEQVRVKGAGV